MPKSPGGLQDFTTVSQWQPVAESFNFLRMKLKIFASATGLLVGLATLTAQTNLFVAADGSAQFTSVQSAIMSVPSGSRENPVVIHIKPGTYKELIYLQREKRFFKLVGDDATNTVLTFNLYAGITNAEGKPIGTFKTPSTTIDADDFTAENLTFENSAGAVGQALAIRVEATVRRSTTAVCSAGRTRFC